MFITHLWQRAAFRFASPPATRFGHDPVARLHSMREPASSNSSHFVVLMMGGSVGSVWLQKLLSSHPLIHCDGELFNSKPLSEFRSWTAASSSAVAVGTRIKFTDLRGQLHFGRPVRAGNRWPALRQLLRDDGSKLVCLYRRNFVKHAVGELRHQLQYEACRGKIQDPWSDAVGSCSAQIDRALPLSTRRFRSGDTLPGLIDMVVASRTQQSELLAACTDEQWLDPLGAARVVQLAYEDLAYVSSELRLTRLQRLGAWLVGARCVTGEACADFRGFAASVTKVTPPDLATSISNYAEVSDRHSNLRPSDLQMHTDLFASCSVGLRRGL